VNAQIGTGVSLATGFITANASRALWIILIPIIAFYFLMDIDRMRRKATLLIPESIRPRAMDVLSRVGVVFSGYVRGLLIVCLMYGIVTTIVLSLLHLKYGIILGLLAGVLYAVPYLGAMVTMLLVFLVGLATYPHGVSQAIWPTLAMIVLNQLIFDPVITPKIIGKSVGLHPVLSLFALLAGGQLFGLVGMILAVPVAASIQEVVFEFCPQLKADPKPAKTKKTRPKKPPAAK
jgi:predicted PurR-regulated permease PerM